MTYEISYEPYTSKNVNIKKKLRLHERYIRIFN